MLKSEGHQGRQYVKPHHTEQPYERLLRHLQAGGHYPLLHLRPELGRRQIAEEQP